MFYEEADQTRHVTTDGDSAGAGQYRDDDGAPIPHSAADKSLFDAKIDSS